MAERPLQRGGLWAPASPGVPCIQAQSLSPNRPPPSPNGKCQDSPLPPHTHPFPAPQPSAQQTAGMWEGWSLSAQGLWDKGTASLSVPRLRTGCREAGRPVQSLQSV